MKPTGHRFFGLPMNTPYPRAAKAAFWFFAVVMVLFIVTAVVSCVAVNSAPDYSWKAISEGKTKL